MWSEAGCPCTGVLFEIKKKAKHRFKYAVRSLRRQKRSIVRRKLAYKRAHCHSRDFWAEVGRLSKPERRSPPLVVDGVTGDKQIATLWANKLNVLYNTHSTMLRDKIRKTLIESCSPCQLFETSITIEDVIESIVHLKNGKKDSTTLSSDHLKSACCIVSDPLSDFFTSVLRHGYMPSALRDCTLIPIPKGLKDPSDSNNYRAIALASTLSKVLERIILSKYSSFLDTHSLQFGFKSGVSTTMCTGLIKNVVAQYTHRGTNVFGCFLDASKAFDLVDHGILFQKLLNRGLPSTVVRFLLLWYQSQQLNVRWNGQISESFGVSNGVRQGGVLSPVLFAIYVDDLLWELERCGVGCYCGCDFVGAVCYADDLALLAPSRSALRLMLSVCENFAARHGLLFNARKTQLIRFTSTVPTHDLSHVNLTFCGESLPFSNEITHLGHILQSDLNDDADILRATKELIKKANFVLNIFSCADVSIKCKLLKSYCLSLYGFPLWNLSSSTINLINIAYNKILRKLWCLPRHSHRRIVHCVAETTCITNLICKRFFSFYKKALLGSYLVRSVYYKSSILCYTFTGYNVCAGEDHLFSYQPNDYIMSNIVRTFRCVYGSKSPFEDVIRDISCS